MASPRQDRMRLRVLMAALAAGEHDQLFVLVEEFGDRLRAVVHRHLRSFGRHDLLARPEEVDFLVLSAALVLLDRAASWDPAGALPWTWADKAIRSAIGQDIGHATLPFDDLDPRGPAAADAASAVAHPPVDRPDAASAGRRLPGDDGLGELRALGRHDGRFLLLVEALGRVGSERDRAVHVQYGLQKHLGDPSPAVTVARETGLRADHVRQIDRRVRVRLRRLAREDETFAPLLGLGWFDDPDRPATPLGRVA